jgi:hypothetical protein
LIDRHTGRLLAVAQARLDPRLRPKLDASDIVQSVFRTFFRRADRGDFTLAEVDDLGALLVQITIRKCHQQADHFLAARRDVRRERQGGTMSGSVDSLDAHSDEAAPEESAALHETVAWLCDQLGSERKRQILDLSLQGYEVVEISKHLGYYERGVERVRAEIKHLLLSLCDEDKATR